jgi:VNT family MFS transporter (synaptic vesicle glycoprotein 2)
MARISRNCYSLDDAIAKAEFGKFNYVLVILSGIILTSGMLESTSIGMVLTIAECELNLSNSHKGFLGSISYIGIILSSHFWGFLADTRGRKRVLVPALFLASAFSMISTLAKSFWTLSLFRFLNGFW